MGSSGTAPQALADLCVARLALGVGANIESSLHWSEAFDASRSHRCASLAWLRSAASIRKLAPADVSVRWRDYAMMEAESARANVLTMARTLAVLGAAGVTPIVLKGLPLAAKLYGEFWVRPTADLDLFVPLEQRRRAHDALLASGWRHVEGDSPSESTYAATSDEHQSYVELHSSLFDENLLAHVDAPPPSCEFVEVDGYAALAQTGPLEAVFLATHLAKHHRVSLLWWIDFATLWNQYDERAKTAARDLSGELGLGRPLSWAERGAEVVGRLEMGSVDDGLHALSQLREMHRHHNARRLIALANGMPDRLRIALAWAFPYAFRRTPIILAGHLVRRARERLAASVRAWSVFRDTPAVDKVSGLSARHPRRIVPVDRPEFVELLRAVMQAGGTLWVRVHGTSMWPTIPAEAIVLLEPTSRGPIVAGQVVLAQLPNGLPVLHRVIRTGSGTLVVKGDNLPEADSSLNLSQVIAVATKLEFDNRQVALSGRPRSSLRAAVSRFRRRLTNA